MADESLTGDVSVRAAWQEMSVPWYRPETGELTVAPFSRREPPPTPVNWAIRPASRRGQSPPARQPIPVGTWLAWLGIVLLLLYLSIVVTQTLRRTRGERTVATKRPSRQIGFATSVEPLPFEIRSDAADYLTRSRNAASRQRFGEAVEYLFAHTLATLDRRHLIHWTAGKTNGAYARDLQSHPRLQRAFNRIRLAFEDHFFGGYDLDEARYDSCRLELERQLSTDSQARSVSE